MTYLSPVHEALAACWDGNQTAMAADLGDPIKRQNIKHWLNAGRIPAEHAPLVEEATRRRGHVVTCERLCPSVRWDVVRGQSQRQVRKVRMAG